MAGAVDEDLPEQLGLVSRGNHVRVAVLVLNRHQAVTRRVQGEDGYPAKPAVVDDVAAHVNPVVVIRIARGRICTARKDLNALQLGLGDPVVRIMLLKTQ